MTVQGHPIRIKVGPHRAKPEHDDVAAAALATGLPRRVLAGQALQQLAGADFSQRAGQAPDWPEDPA